ncbi:MAG: hypothetical protein KGJ23_08555 [Euryarchaeota archaeon]|nr:hypothetical protein [Euryarchaeota archaeon]MDE1836653.1 hypothetical protein [Euryarchaeota archaeon]MDE1880318.1 hypothetical protein [Euryarchaeota archaeon]MDE2044623.1 hypothetical protein [Thermoplasmata archaeon]
MEAEKGGWGDIKLQKLEEGPIGKMANWPLAKRLLRQYYPSAVAWHEPRPGKKEELAAQRRFWESRSVLNGPVRMWAPESFNYEPALKLLRHGDVVLDAGAGNLAFAVLAAEVCRKVYAVEIVPETLADGLKELGWELPKNLVPICADFRTPPLPTDVSRIVLLVVHFQGLVDQWKGREVIRATQAGVSVDRTGVVEAPAP